MKKRILPLMLSAAAVLTLMTGCAAGDKRALVEIDGGRDQIDFGYGKFVAYETQAVYDIMYSSQLGDSMWSSDPYNSGKTLTESVKADLLESMKTSYYLRKNASKYNVKLTAADKKKIEKTTTKFMKENSKKGLKQLNAKEAYVREFLENRVYMSKMQKAIEAKADATVTDEEANQKKISYVFFNKKEKTDSDGNTATPSDDEIKGYRESAEKISKASDFDKAVKDASLTASTKTFGQNELKEAKAASEKSTSTSDLPYDFLKACDSLKDGGNTDVIETESGFYVGHMVTVSDADATATEKNTLAEEKKQKYYQKVLDGFEAKSTWKVNKKLWKQVRFIDRFKGSAFDKSSGTTSGTVSDGN